MDRSGSGAIVQRLEVPDGMRFSTLWLAFVCAAGGVSLASCNGEEPAPQPTQIGPEIIKGPVRSSKEIRAFSLNGLRLGMPLEVAQRTLEEQGFAQRAINSQPITDTSGRHLGDIADYWGVQPVSQPDRDGEIKCAAPIGNLVHLGYVNIGNEGPILASITYHAPVTCDDLRNADSKRKEITSRFGNPTLWTKTTYSSGFIGDQMSFSPNVNLADDVEYAKVSSCLLNWQQQKLCYGTDCRKVLSAANGAIMRVGYQGWETYELDDLTAQRVSLMRDPLFMKQDTTGKECHEGLLE